MTSSLLSACWYERIKAVFLLSQCFCFSLHIINTVVSILSSAAIFFELCLYRRFWKYFGSKILLSQPISLNLRMYPPFFICIFWTFLPYSLLWPCLKKMRIYIKLSTSKLFFFTYYNIFKGIYFKYFMCGGVGYY